MDTVVHQHIITHRENTKSPNITIDLERVNKSIKVIKEKRIKEYQTI